MKEPLSFDHRPDPRLGDALRQALEPADVAAFVARVLARAEHAPASVSWEAVLARWARAGVAAAMFVAALAGYVVGRAAAPPTSRPSLDYALLAPAQPGDVEIVLASVIGN
jgi:hypothetical protein